ncbi:MAG: tetratricopeptide repeat protein [Cyclobacteriaceae bacterium]
MLVINTVLYFWSFLLLLIVQPVLGNNLFANEISRDSTILEEYINQAEDYRHTKPDSAILLLEKAIKIAEKLNSSGKKYMAFNKLGFLYHDIGQQVEAEKILLKNIEIQKAQDDSLLLADALLSAGVFYSNRTEFTKAKEYLEHALDIYSANDDQKGIAESNNYLGILFDQQGFYSRALESYYSSLEIYYTLNDSVEIGNQYNNIAIVYNRQGDGKTSLEYFQKSMAIKEQYQDSVNMAITAANLGLIHKKLGNLSEAEKRYIWSLNVFEANNSYPFIAIGYHNLGELKLAQEKYDSAMTCFQRSQELASKIDLKNAQIGNQIGMAKIHLQNKDYTKSLKIASESLMLAKEFELLDEQKDLNQLISKIYEALGEHQQALIYYRNYALIKDSIINETGIRLANRLRATYELEQKDFEIQQLRKEKKLESEKADTKKRLNQVLVVSVIVFFILLVIAVVAYIRTKSMNETLIVQKMQIETQSKEIEKSQKTLIKTNKKLQDINKEKDEIIAMVAHDLRSPLNNIKGLLSLVEMEDNSNLSKNQKSYFEMAQKSTNTLRDRINRILDLEAINESKVVLKPQIIDVREITEEILVNFKEAAYKKNINLVSDNVKTEVYVYVDRNYLLQIFENLVSNAIKFSPPDKSIFLKLTYSDDLVRIHVKDQGPGIKAEDQKKLFSKYQQLTAKPTGDEQSSGLGLAIVKKYTEAMGGKVWCVSNPGNGAEFIVEFPKSQLHSVPKKSKSKSKVQE